MKKKEPHTSSLLDVYDARAKRKRRIFIFFGIVFLVCFFFGGAWVLFRSPFFKVEKVEVRGNAYTNADDITGLFKSAILRSSGFTRFMGAGNMLAWPTALLPGDLASVPRIKNLSVVKNWGTHVITITVTERIPVGVWCQKMPTNADETLRQSSGQAQMNADATSSISTNPRVDLRESAGESCWWFDNDGLAFESAPAIEGSLIHAVDDYSASATSSTAHTVGLYQKILPPEFIPNLFSIFTVLDDSGFAIREVRLDDLALEEIKVLTYDGPELYFSLRFPAQNASAVLQSLSQSGNISQLQYVDFRVENRAYYK